MAEIQNVQGLAQLSALLKTLPAHLAKKHLRAAVAEGAKLVRNDARTRAPVSSGAKAKGAPSSGTLKKSIVMKSIPEKSHLERQTFYVTVRRGKKFQRVTRRKKGQSTTVNLDAFYWRFVEFGTKFITAQPFMRPAFEMQKKAAVDAIAARLKSGIAQSVSELKR